MLAMSSSTWLSTLADVASLLGFVATGVIAYFTRSLAERVRTKVRVPQLKKSLAVHAKSLSESMVGWPQAKQSAIEAVSRAEAVLRNAEPKLTGIEKSKVVDVLKLARGRSSGIFKKASLQGCSEDDLWGIYQGLVGVISALEQLEKDARLE